MISSVTNLYFFSIWFVFVSYYKYMFSVSFSYCLGSGYLLDIWPGEWRCIRYQCLGDLEVLAISVEGFPMGWPFIFLSVRSVV